MQKIIFKLLIFLFAFELQAFTSVNEVMGIKVLRQLDQNVYLLKRGIQDGLKINHHLRIRDEEGFITRGIVIALDQVKFLAFTYHRYRPKALNLQNDLIISWLHQKFIPWQLKEKISGLYVKKYLDQINYLSWKEKVEQKKRKDKYLNKEWDKSRFVGTKYIVNEKPLNLSDYQFEKLKLKVFAAPMEISSFNDSRNYSFGFHVKAIRNENLRTNFKYQYKRIALSDPFTKEDISHRNHNGEFLMDWKYFKNNRWRVVSYLSYQRASEGELSFIQKRVQLAPFGLEYLIKSQNFEDVHLGIRPMYEHLSLEIAGSNATIAEKEGNDARFGFYFHSEKYVTKKLFWDIDFLYAPKFYVSKSKTDHEDNLFTIASSLSYFASENFSVSYAYKFHRDVILYEEYGLSNDYSSHRFSFNYLYNFR